MNWQYVVRSSPETATESKVSPKMLLIWFFSQQLLGDLQKVLAVCQNVDMVLLKFFKNYEIYEWI